MTLRAGPTDSPDPQHDGCARRTADHDGSDASPPSRHDHRPAIACGIGLGLGLCPFLFILSAGSGSFLQWVPAGNIFDDQARSLLHGRLDVDPRIASIEAFNVKGRSYLYFGPFPALLRVPVVALTHSFDGRLGQLSILLAWTVFACSCGVLFYQIWRLFGRPTGGPVIDIFLPSTFGLVLSGGSIVAYLAQRAGVHDEALMWGLAGAIASLAAIFTHLWSTRAASLGLASFFASIAILSRVTLGLSPVLFLLSLAVIAVAAQRQRLISWCDSLLPGRLLVAVAVPLVLFVAVQVAKFHSLQVHPADQAVAKGDPFLPTYLAANGNTYFRLRFLPTNVLTMVFWPAGLRVARGFPWVFPDQRSLSPVLGGAVFMRRSWSGSILSTQTLFCLLGAAGLLATVAKLGFPARVRLVTVAIIVSGLAFVPTLAYSYQYFRFLTDAMPALILASSAGVAALLAHWPRGSHARSAAAFVIAVVAAFTMWVNLSMGLLDQSIFAWAPRPPALERFLALRTMTGSSLIGAHIALGDRFPTPAGPGALLVIGDCDAL